MTKDNRAQLPVRLSGRAIAGTVVAVGVVLVFVFLSLGRLGSSDDGQGSGPEVSFAPAAQTGPPVDLKPPPVPKPRPRVEPDPIPVDPAAEFAAMDFMPGGEERLADPVEVHVAKQLEMRRAVYQAALLDTGEGVGVGAPSSLPALPPGLPEMVEELGNVRSDLVGLMRPGGPGGHRRDSEGVFSPEAIELLGGQLTGQNGVSAESRAAAAAMFGVEHAGGQLGEARTSSTRLQRVPPSTLLPGEKIEAVLLHDLMSDLPGPVEAMVTKSEYSREGSVLVPSGTKLVGRYSNQLIRGQSRLEVQILRMVTPDGLVAELPVLPVVDAEGQAGMVDRVNHHTWPTFGRALMVGLVSAGLQLSQPSDDRGDGALSSREIASGAVGQEFGRTATELLRQGARRAPTIRIREGTRFDLFVEAPLTFSFR